MKKYYILIIIAGLCISGLLYLALHINIVQSHNTDLEQNDSKKTEAAETDDGSEITKIQGNTLEQATSALGNSSLEQASINPSNDSQPIEEIKNVTINSSPWVSSEDIDILTSDSQAIYDSIMDFSDIWFGGNRGAILSKDKNGRLGIFCGIKYPVHELSTDKRYVYYLPNCFSDSLRMFNFEDWVKTTHNGYAINDPSVLKYGQIGGIPEENRLLLIDTTNNLIAIAKMSHNKLTFELLTRVTGSITLNDLRFVVAYDDRLVFESRGGNTLLIFDTNEFSLVESREMDNWETFRGAYCKIDNTSERIICLMQVNRSLNQTRVYELANAQVVKQFNMECLLDQQYLMDMYTDREGRILFIYNTPQSQKIWNLYIYSLLDNKLSMFVESELNKDIFNSIVNIDNLFFFYDWNDEVGYLVKKISIFDKEGTANPKLEVENEFYKTSHDFSIMENTSDFIVSN